MRDSLLVLIVTFAALSLILGGLGARQLNQFIRAVPAITSVQDLRQLKRMVAFQMYAAAFQVLILVLPLFIYGIGVWQNTLRTGDLVFVALPVAAVGLVGTLIKRMERTVRAMPVKEEFQEEFERVVLIWQKRIFPDW